jgi:hypothetical protein
VVDQGYFKRSLRLLHETIKHVDEVNIKAFDEEDLDLGRVGDHPACFSKDMPRISKVWLQALLCHGSENASVVTI